MFDFLILMLIALCVGVTPVFALEYRQRTDAVILSTLYGKSKLGVAKIVAAMLFALSVMLVGLAIVIGLPLLFYGAEGADLPIQLMSVSIPYALTFGQTTLLLSGIALLVALGLTAFMLFLSARWRSTLGILMPGVAVSLLPMFIPLSNGLVLHGFVLLPGMTFSFSTLFKTMLSYPLGLFVFDVQTVILSVYLTILVVFTVLAMRAFKRHQVA